MNFNKKRHFLVFCASLLAIYPIMNLNLIYSINFNKNLLTLNLSELYQNLKPKLSLQKEINDLNFSNFFYNKKEFLRNLKNRIHDDYKSHRVYFYKNTYYSLTEMKISYIVHHI